MTKHFRQNNSLRCEKNLMASQSLPFVLVPLEIENMINIQRTNERFSLFLTSNYEKACCGQLYLTNMIALDMFSLIRFVLNIFSEFPNIPPRPKNQAIIRSATEDLLIY